MAYELLFGDRPFDGKKTADVMRKITSEPVQVPEKAPRKISPDGVDFVMRVSYLLFHASTRARTDADVSSYSTAIRASALGAGPPT